MLAKAGVTNEEINRKLDLILDKVSGLEHRITTIESESTKIKKEISKVKKTATEAKSASNAISIPQDPEEKKSFLSNLRNQLRSQEANSSGPWTKKENWDKVEKNMTEFNARKILGDPDKIKNSHNPRIENVYMYVGDLNGDGVEEIGLINITRNRVHSFVSPF